MNGEVIFIWGGNWIVLDVLLCFFKECYNVEIGFYVVMNLNMICIWVGVLVECFEFYDVCDRYGFLVSDLNLGI